MNAILPHSLSAAADDSDDRAAPRVLVPVRWDPEYRDAILRILETVARTRPGAAVTLLNVIEPSPASDDNRSFHWLDALDELNRSLTLSTGTTLDRMERRREEMLAWIRAGAPAELRAALHLSAECCVGDPAVEIARYARDERIDLVILGDRRTRWRWPLRPNVTSRVLDRIDLPVMIVRPNPKPELATV
jgi:nucleotide-binding universal stress UspA family protein